LEELALEGPAWRTPRSFTGKDAAALVDATRERCLEGVVAKRLDAPYEAGRRSGAWVKQKHRRRETFVITGWVQGGERKPDAVVLARAHRDGLSYAGDASYGLSVDERAALSA
jgi:bifunctional non-homologous end joining protein LigD